MTTRTNEGPVKKFGQKLRQLRNDKQLSQRALAQKIKVSYGTIQLYEKKNAVPSAEIVARIARLFQVSADSLIFDEEGALEKVQDRELMEYFVKADQLNHRHKFLIKELIESLAAREELEQQLASQGQGSSPKSSHRGRRAA